ncbi:SDR family NAD(P)-dependent oxidoreductase [Azotobacter vinelandii]
MDPISTGTVVVIAGASSGIGRATAHAFAERGARLLLAARRTAHGARRCSRRWRASAGIWAAAPSPWAPT